MPARWILLLAAVALAAAGCQADDGAPQARAPAGDAQPAAAQADPRGLAPAEGVTVTGHGRVSGVPDTLRATVGVHVTRADVDQAFDDAAAAADRVLAAVGEHGVAEEDVQTREFSVRPEQEHRPDQPPAITGYTVRNLVEVTIRDTDQAGGLLAAVAEAGGDDTRVEGLRFSLEDNDAQLRQAREQAFADARAKAEHYAELAGLELGELVSVSEVGADRPRPVEFADEALAERAAPAPVMPGQQEVGVQLQATWALN